MTNINNINTTDNKSVITRIDSQSMEPIQYKASTYRVNIPQEMTLDNLLTPEAWIDVTRKFPQITVGDLIQCVKEDLSLFVELFVVGSPMKNSDSKDVIFVKVLRVVKLDEEISDTEEDSVSPYKAKFFPNSIKKWGIIRVSDGQEKISGLSSKIEAINWIKNRG